MICLATKESIMSRPTEARRESPTLFTLSKKQWREFCAALAKPPKSIPALHELLTKPGLFDTKAER
jgi:uncharacterized protein (DUF1778 family)